MDEKSITIQISLPAAKAMLIYGAELAERNKKCEPAVSEGLDAMAFDIWKALTNLGEIDELNKSIMQGFSAKNRK